jgi:hypothetical protein
MTEYTELEKGIVVTISPFEFASLKNKTGFLPFETYPTKYKEMALKNEVGRFLFFRFILEVDK